MDGRQRREKLLGNVITIQPLAFPDGPYFGCQKLSVCALQKAGHEFPRCYQQDTRLWHLAASLGEGDAMPDVDPVRQIGSIIVVSTVEDARKICDQWVQDAVQLQIRKSGSVVECAILDITEQPIPGQASFVRQYEINRQVTYPPMA